MGRVKCKKHGSQGFYEVCNHIRESLNNGIYPNFIKANIVNVLVCNECYNKYKGDEIKEFEIEEIIDLPEAQVRKIEIQFDEIYNSIKRSIVCSACMWELEINHSRRSGKEDPFNAYDKTLLYENKNRIKELGNSLRATFEFGRSKHPLVDTDLLSLIYGTIKNPFHIKIYEKTKLEEINEIRSFISSYFEGEELYQRKITFLKSENWIHEGGTIYRGEQEIIFEEIIK